MTCYFYCELHSYLECHPCRSWVHHGKPNCATLGGHPFGNDPARTTRLFAVYYRKSSVTDWRYVRGWMGWMNGIRGRSLLTHFTRVACHAASVYSGAETMRTTSFTGRLLAVGDDMCQLSQASRLFQQASHVSTTHQIHVRGQELLPSFIVLRHVKLFLCSTFILPAYPAIVDSDTPVPTTST